MFSYKRLMLVLVSLVFALLSPGLNDFSADSWRYIVFWGGMFLLLIYYLHRQGWFDEEKMIDKVAKKREEKEHKIYQRKEDKNDG